MAIARSMPASTGTENYIGAVVLAGPTQESGVFKIAPVSPPGEMAVTNLPAGNNILTMALIRTGRLMVSTSPGNTSLFVPKLANMVGIGGYTFNPNNPVNGLFFAVQRLGLGLLAVNFDLAGGAILHSNDLSPETRPRFATGTSYRLIGIDEWLEE